ncbi:MAG: aminopeptidase P family protein, partial [Firmicutes bacterium]|nr:aminopeptidase P family protein [Bacillota bacterium]
RAYLLTDFRYFERAQALAPYWEAVQIDRQYTLNSFLQELRPENLAVEESIVSHSFYKQVGETGIPLVAGDGLVEKLRAVKEPEELEKIQKAEALGDDCYTHLLGWFRPGVTERETALEIQKFFLENGAEGLSFDTICLFGANTSLPHGEPGNAVLKPGDFITLDFGCVVDGYCSDMTRTLALGPITQEQKDLYRIVLEAQMEACKKIRPGITGKEADAFAREIISQAGYGEFFGHGLGHGVGLEIHEAPTLNPSGAEILAENMVVTIEPGIYLPGKYGIRIEDLAILTESVIMKNGYCGIINTVQSSKELIIL